MPAYLDYSNINTMNGRDPLPVASAAPPPDPAQIVRSLANRAGYLQQQQQPPPGDPSLFFGPQINQYNPYDQQSDLNKKRLADSLHARMAKKMNVSGMSPAQQQAAAMSQIHQELAREASYMSKVR